MSHGLFSRAFPSERFFETGLFFLFLFVEGCFFHFAACLFESPLVFRSLLRMYVSRISFYVNWTPFLTFSVCPKTLSVFQVERDVMSSLLTYSSSLGIRGSRASFRSVPPRETFRSVEIGR